MSQSAPESAKVAGFSPEAQLVLWSARVCDDATRQQKIREIVLGPVDWARLIEIAEHNGMVPALFWSLNTSCPEMVPAELLLRLRESFQKNLVYNLYLTRELSELLRDFEKQGIKALPFKGPMVLDPLYERPAMRDIWDLDILVPKADVLRAKSILMARGYRPEKPMSPREEQAFLETDCEYNFDREDEMVHVELHWDLLPQWQHLPYGAADLWACAVPTRLGGVETLTLPPEEMFLLLCIHGGYKHEWSRLKRVWDIALLFSRFPDLDYASVLARADSLGFRRNLLVGCRLAQVLLHAPLPPALAQSIAGNSSVESFSALARGRLFRRGFGLPRFPEWLEYLRDARAGCGDDAPMSRPRSLLLYLRSILTPEWADLRTLALPRWLYFFYHVYRPARVLCAQGPRIFRRIF